MARAGVLSRRVPFRVTNGATVYNFLCLPEIQRVQIDDSPPHVPTSGEQEAKSRPYHNVFAIKDIKDAFAHQGELHFEDHRGVLDHLADSNLDTRWGPLYAPPVENNPTMATDAGSSIVAGANVANIGARPGAVTGPNCNPRPWRYFQGTTNSGIFSWRVDDVAANNYDLDILRWSGTAWGEEANLHAATAREDIAAMDMEVHKAGLHVLYVGATGLTLVATSTNGDTFANLTNSPGLLSGMRQGSRLVSFGNTLYCFYHNNGRSLRVSYTADDGATAWTDVSGTVLTGQLRDVCLFFDRNEVSRIMLLTEDALYYYDTTNNVAVYLLTLPYGGRAMQQIGKDELFIFLDAGRVLAYNWAGGAPRDESPGGAQGMPDGKDFGIDASGQVCLAAGTYGLFALWSGQDSNAVALAPLILFRFYSRPGWHYIWQKGDTSVSNAARFIAVDPISGDLIGAVQDAINVDSLLLRFQDIEVSPDLQATQDRSAAAVTFTTPRLSFGSPLISTTIWDVFCHTAGLGTSKSLAVAYRVDGSTGAFTTVGSATTTNNKTFAFPDDAASAAGLNFRDVQLRFTLDLNLVSDDVKVFEVDVGFTRIWTPRYVHIVTIDSNAKGTGIPVSDRVVANVDTIQALATKVAIKYGNKATKYALPIAPLRAREMVGDLATPESNPMTGLYTLSFLEP